MIRVEEQDEPSDFDTVVRLPGKAYLAVNRNPTTKEFSSHAYWTRILPQLREGYRRICAYSCFYIPPTTGWDNVEHFLPKSRYPESAYEWSNYRYVCQRLNGRKGTKKNVLDPFHVQDGWFVINFPSLLVVPSQEVSLQIRSKVQDTIDELLLNDPSTCLHQRENYVMDFCKQIFPFDFLEREAPFLAMEIQRQGYAETLNDIMQY